MAKEATRSLTCAHCCAPLEFNESDEIVKCAFCNSTYSVADLLNESDSVRIEKIKNKRAFMKDKLKSDKGKEGIKPFKKTKFSKVLIVFFVIGIILCFASFEERNLAAGIIAVVLTALFMCSWLMGMKIIKEPKQGIRTLAAVIGFVLLIPYSSVSNNPTYVSEKMIWSDMELSNVLPQPSSDMGRVLSDYDDYLSVYVDNISSSDYKTYANSCENAGFDIDKSKSDTSFTAYNDDGYRLYLWYDKNDDQLQITLNAPVDMYEFSWPVNRLAELLPKPQSNIGAVEWEYSDSFSMYVGETDRTAFIEYADACIDAGFDVDYLKGDDYFYADNGDGYKLSVSYEGFNTMRINMYK